jgi:KUP system potassium uptake protein
LFFIQQYGSSIVGKAFGPIMFLWFTMMGVLGISYIIQMPSILKGLNPYYAYQLLTSNYNAFIILGAVFLCTPGPRLYTLTWGIAAAQTSGQPGYM